jgi:mono/diheme cytochrome c family protein
MPSWAAVLGAEGTPQVTAYVRSLAGLGHNATAAEAGKARYEHDLRGLPWASEGKGNPALGAPDLTDSAWLYGSSEAAITESLTKGRAGQMPAHAPLIGEDAVKNGGRLRVQSARSEAPVAQTEGSTEMQGTDSGRETNLDSQAGASAPVPLMQRVGAVLWPSFLRRLRGHDGVFRLRRPHGAGQHHLPAGGHPATVGLHLGLLHVLGLHFQQQPVHVDPAAAARGD